MGVTNPDTNANNNENVLVDYRHLFTQNFNTQFLLLQPEDMEPKEEEGGAMKEMHKYLVSKRESTHLLSDGHFWSRNYD